jgi:LEA14-like dessication related protein
LDKTRVVKALMLLISTAAAAAPIFYALNEYGGNIQALVMPSYIPPKIDFRMEPSGVRFEGRQLLASFRLTNLGEVRLVFEGLNGTAYGPDGKALASASLDRAVSLPPNSTEVLMLKISLDGEALKRLVRYFEGRESIKVEVRGEASMLVFGSKVKAPISASFEIGLADVRAIG